MKSKIDIPQKLSIQEDGKIVAGGWFTTYKGSSSNRIARINSDGSRDTSFNVGTGFNNSYVNTIAIQEDGKILVGGQFTTYNGTPINRIARINTDGSLDTSFNVGSGFNSNVWSIEIQEDGKILIGGQFTNYKGIPYDRIIRLNPDGTTED